MKKIFFVFLFLLSLHTRGFSQTTIPTSWDCDSATIPEFGWITNLTDYYTSDSIGYFHWPPSAMFNNTGSNITISFYNNPGDLVYYIRGDNFSGGTFSVEESKDSIIWTPLHIYTANMPDTDLSISSTPVTDHPDLESRFIRFIYTTKVVGNVTIDDIEIKQNRTDIYPITASPGETTSYATCENVFDTLILYKPTWATSGIHWEQLPTQLWQDSLIITTANDGHWDFHSSQGSVDINVYFNSGNPYWSWAADTIFTCDTLHAQQLFAQPGTTYLWSTNDTTESIEAIYPGTYSVTVTNGCGTSQDQITIIWSGIGPLPNLGPDDTVCFGVTIAPGTFASYLWNDLTTQPSLTVSSSGIYFVTVPIGSGCFACDTVQIQIDTAISIEMCYVSFDTVTLKNAIYWFVDPGQSRIDSIRVEVKNQFGVFVPIGTAPYTQGVIIDWVSNPLANNNEYRIVSINFCGQVQYSQIHRSIWLTTLSNELQWQNYYGPTMPLYYLVFAAMQDGSIVAIDTVPACSGSGCLNHSPIVTNPLILKYFVALEQNCSNNKTNGWILSNYMEAQSGVIEVEKLAVKIFPNPVVGSLQILTERNIKIVKIIDASGRVLLTTNQKVIDCSSLANGFYFIFVYTEDGLFKNKFVVER